MTNIQEAYERHIASYGIHPTCMMAGAEDSDIILIGEYPGASEAAKGTPFSGESGKLLWNALRQQKILRPDCYVTNVIKRQVTARDNVQSHELALWQEALHFELSLLTAPKIIVCLGNTALNALLGFDKITKYRGSVYSYKINGQDIPVVIANSPASILRMPETEIIFSMDIAKVSRVLNGDYKEHKVTTILNPSYDAAMNYLDAIRRKHKIFSTDIEVTGYETACIGLGISAHEAMCINFRDAKTSTYTVEEEFNLLQSFVTTCDQDDTFVIAQNGNFDSYFMGYKDHAIFKVDFDTLLAHHTLYPRLPHNLGFLTSQYTDHPYYKDDKDAFREGGDINDFWRYNGTDCGITFAVYEEELKELKAQKLDTFFFKHVMRLQPHLSESTVTGVAIDKSIKDRLSKEIGADVTKLRNDVVIAARRAANDHELEINPNSPKQVTKLLFDTLHLKYHKRTADAQTREDLMKDARTGIEAKEFLGKLGKYAEEAKFFSTYVETEIDSDDRFRAEFKQYGVSKAPGRLSSGKTLWGSGGNAQNQPHRAYEMYVADQGCVFIYFDLAQAEARYVAWDANIEHWIEDFERARLEGGFDAHRSLASTMFKMPYDEVPTEDWLDSAGRSLKDPECDMTSLTFTKRFIAKRCRHGLNYRMHIARLAQTTGMTYSQAASNYYTYHRINPELQAWWSDIEREIKKTRTLFNSFGRRFIVLERLEKSKIMDSIIAFKPQSTIGDKTQRVWYQCHEDPRWDKNKARIALNVHDALYGIATPEYAATALSIMKKYAEEPIMVQRTKDKVIVPMIIPADCKMSKADASGFHRMSNLSAYDVEAAK
jgi:uracil-DNA glycosylase